MSVMSSIGGAPLNAYAIAAGSGAIIDDAVASMSIAMIVLGAPVARRIAAADLPLAIAAGGIGTRAAIGSTAIGLALSLGADGSRLAALSGAVSITTTTMLVATMRQGLVAAARVELTARLVPAWRYLHRAPAYRQAHVAYDARSIDIPPDPDARVAADRPAALASPAARIAHHPAEIRRAVVPAEPIPALTDDGRFLQ